ncbi:MAG: PfkB family carbohydrate kinase [Candidatus Falkowbacteria bacterium]|nr:PfkB family carbohydrate kinase [Candidatus Falkowbacteria bacterium]
MIKSMKYDVITIGSALEDITFFTSEGKLINNKKDLLRQKMLAFEHGAKIKVDKVFHSFGGGAANTAVVFANFGFKVATIVNLGKDAKGDKIIKNFKDQGVSTKLIQKQKKSETGYSFILASSNHANEHVIFPERGANAELSITNQALRQLKKTKWIYLTSMYSNWEDNFEKIFSIDSAKIAWNIGNAQIKRKNRILAKFLKKTNVLILNKDEALELALTIPKNKKLTSKFLNNTHNLLRMIKDLGPQMVLITSGRKGADVLKRKKIYHQDPFKEKKRADTTGVGDAFGSSFIAGLERFDNNINKALRLASENSASVIAEIGAQNGLIKRKL